MEWTENIIYMRILLGISVLFCSFAWPIVGGLKKMPEWDGAVRGSEREQKQERENEQEDAGFYLSQGSFDAWRCWLLLKLSNNTPKSTNRVILIQISEENELIDMSFSCRFNWCVRWARFLFKLAFFGMLWEKNAIRWKVFSSFLL